jgi:GH25 family lysozyme M1 (1,4-beta-N-acetylmuramidase)
MKIGRWLVLALAVLTVAASLAAVIITTTPAEYNRPPLMDNPLKPQDFAYENGFLTCKTAEYVLGIDVSEYQMDIDWDAVKNAGMEFVFIRIGWRGMESASLNADKRAQEYYEGAKKAGLLVGAYFFSQAVSMEEAAEEAQFAIELLEDWELDLPLVYDWEYTGPDNRVANVDRRTLTDCTRVFCRKVEDAGLAPMFYFNKSQALHLLHMEELTEFPFWLAQYMDGMDFPYRVDFWQYTGEGIVPGIKVPVDVNLWLK